MPYINNRWPRVVTVSSGVHAYPTSTTCQVAASTKTVGAIMVTWCAAGGNLSAQITPPTGFSEFYSWAYRGVGVNGGMKAAVRVIDGSEPNYLTWSGASAFDDQTIVGSATIIRARAGATIVSSIGKASGSNLWGDPVPFNQAPSLEPGSLTFSLALCYTSTGNSNLYMEARPIRDTVYTPGFLEFYNDESANYQVTCQISEWNNTATTVGAPRLLYALPSPAYTFGTNNQWGILNLTFLPANQSLDLFV